MSRFFGAGALSILLVLLVAGGAQPAMLAGARGVFQRVPLQLAPDNQPLTVKVLVLNYDPLVPAEGNRRLSEVFGWNSAEQLASGYKAALEDASGNAVRFEIAEFRTLNEIYAQVDGYRYTIEEYVQNRRNGSGWHDGGGADYPRLLNEQGVPPLVDAGKVDEVWVFSDHFFGLWESSMAGPGAFFVNGGVYPEVPSRRPFVLYGFNYERGVPEMLHNTCHRTEASMNRFYGDWNLAAPNTPWGFFSANDVQSNGQAGVGTCHWPANAQQDYDYGNPRVIQSWADDFYNYPNLTFTTRPVSAATWDVTGDAQFDYLKWYFGHLPRAKGVHPDGHQNNWWKYLFDFQNYSDTGDALPLRAWLFPVAPSPTGAAEVRFQVAYSSAVPIDVTGLDGNDMLVVGPNGNTYSAQLIAVSDPTDGTYRVATYRVAAPGGLWDATEVGTYALSIPAGQVFDRLGAALPATDLGAFQVIRTASTPPSNLAVTAATFDRVDLHWTDNSDGESGFEIQRATDADFATIATSGPDTTSYSDSAVSADTSYVYRVRALAPAGASDYSNEVSVRTPLVVNAPAAPSRLQVTAVSSSRLDLVWQDNSGNESAFKLERKTGSGTYSQVAAPSVNATTYSDTGLSPSTTYTYRIRATNAGGDSTYSNEAPATTLAPTRGVLQVARKVDFGQVKAKRTKTKVVVLRNSSATENLRVTVGTVAAPFTVPSGGGTVLLTPGGSTSVKLSFRPLRRGKKTGRLTLGSTDPKNGSVSILLTGVGR